jgi:hypothetical protein
MRVIRGHQWSSDAFSGTPRHSVAISKAAIMSGNHLRTSSACSEPRYVTKPSLSILSNLHAEIVSTVADRRSSVRSPRSPARSHARSHSDRTQIAISRMHLLWFCRANLPNMAPSRMTRTSVVSGALPSAAAFAAASMASAVVGSDTSRMVTTHCPACRMYLRRYAIRGHQQPSAAIRRPSGVIRRPSRHT